MKNDYSFEQLYQAFEKTCKKHFVELYEKQDLSNDDKAKTFFNDIKELTEEILKQYV